MYQLNFDVPIHVHFIGIGGISMSGLAQILLTRGFTISGSDTHETPITKHLARKGLLSIIPSRQRTSPRILIWSCIRLPSIG